MIRCSKCKQTKPPSEFPPRFKEGKRHRRKAPTCTVCEKKVYDHHIHDTYITYIGRLVTESRSRSKRRGIHFDNRLNRQALVEMFEAQQGLCAVTQFPMTWRHEKRSANHGSRRGTNISIDRIDSDKGYTKSNIRLVCQRVNAMKSRMSDHDLLFWTTLITEGLKDKELP